MYFEHKNLYELLAFIRWWCGSLARPWPWEDVRDPDGELFTALNDFIVEKLQKKWKAWYHEALMQECGNDPEKAFDLYFEMYDAFKKEHDIFTEYDQRPDSSETILR